jgi:hypothetical protein
MYAYVYSTANAVVENAGECVTTLRIILENIGQRVQYSVRNSGEYRPTCTLFCKKFWRMQGNVYTIL